MDYLSADEKQRLEAQLKHCTSMTAIEDVIINGRVNVNLAPRAVLSGIPGLEPQTVERIGQGAQMVLLLDRSSSMDRPFAGSQGPLLSR